MKYSFLHSASIFILLFIFNITVTFAQTRTITGTILNGNTGKPVSGIYVEVQGVNEKAYSSSTGDYSLSIPDTLKTITFKDFPGMEIMEIKFVNLNVIDIYLAEIDIYDLSIEELMKIKVSTAGKQEQEISHIPASVLVISRNEIENMGYLYLKDIIRNIPGYYAMGNLGVDIFGVRGFAKDKGLNFIVLMNGINITDDQILGYYDIPVQAIDKIEIIRGPMAVIYGDNAFFGVINIFTNSKKVSDFSNIASIMMGSKALINSFLTVSNQIKDLKYSLNCSYQKSDGANYDITRMIKDPSVMSILT